jgi:signal transduction histidine kinase
MLSNDELMRETLYFIAQQGWAESGKSYLNSLVEFLGKSLEVEYALIDELMPSGTRAKTIGLYANGAVVHNIEYELATTPCENVMDKKLCVYTCGVQALFPDDNLLVQMNVDSYMGIPLWDSKGSPIGLIAIMGNRPIKDVDIAKNVLQIVAVRTAHEIERRRDGEALAKYYNELEETVKERTKDLQDANRRLENANSEIMSINDKLHTLVGITYHDLTNQLMVLNGSLSMLERQPLDGNAKEWLSRMERSLNIISRTLELSKDYARVAVKEPEWQQLSPIVEKLNNPRVTIKADVKGLSILADPLFPKVFYNLMDNAEKHGSGVDQISVHYCVDEDDLNVIWEDNGKGIPADKKVTMFQRNPEDERVHGLYLIKKILNVTGISIEEDGVPGKGARFTIHIPSGSHRIS